VLDEPVEFLVGGRDLLPALESALQGYSAGATLTLQIEPEQAFGDFNDQLIFLEPRGLFPPELQEGQTLEGFALPAGCHAHAPKDVLYTVTDIYPEHVILDGNHPLAGIAIRLQLQVHAVRAASAEETERQSAGTAFFRLHALAAQPQDGPLH